MRINITLKGRPISKKNSRRHIKRGGRKYVVPSVAYEKWEANAYVQIKEQYPKLKFLGRVKVDYQFYFKGRLWVDVDNAIAGINDILEKVGIVEDDRQIKTGSFDTEEGCKDWETLLIITEL